MSELSLTRVLTNGIELLIDTGSGAVFASQGMIAKICDQQSSSIRYFFQKEGVEESLQSFPVADSKGVERLVKLYDEDAIFKAFAKYNPELLLACAKSGIRVFLQSLADHSF
jgi:hypothetical protein